MDKPAIFAQAIIAGERYELIDPTDRDATARFLRELREVKHRLGLPPIRRVAEHQYEVMGTSGLPLYEILVETFEPEPEPASYYGADTAEEAAAELGHADAAYYRSR